MPRRIRPSYWCAIVGLAIVGLASVPIVATVWFMMLHPAVLRANETPGGVDLGSRDLSSRLVGKFRRLAVCIQVVEGTPTTPATSNAGCAPPSRRFAASSHSIQAFRQTWSFRR
jgi:hypothetical protein